MDLLDKILNTQKEVRDHKVQSFKTLFAEEEKVAVKTALAKAKQVEELERLKVKHEQELEALKDKHDRENNRLGGEKEKETQNDQIQKKREADRKANEKQSASESVEEGKLVTSAIDIIKLITKKVADRLEKEYSRNPEKGLGMINTIGAMVGHKVTNKSQEKGKLFLKFGEETIMEGVDIKKALKSVKGLTKKQTEMMMTLPSSVIMNLVQQLSSVVMGEEGVEEGYYSDKDKKQKATLKKHDKRMIKISRDSIKKYEKGRKEETEVEEDRDYKKEYESYHSDPEQIKRRAKRNEARRSLKNSKKLTADKDVHHKDNNPMNNDKSNLSIVSQNYNRKEPRMRDKLKEKGCLPNDKKRK